MGHRRPWRLPRNLLTLPVAAAGRSSVVNEVGETAAFHDEMFRRSACAVSFRNQAQAFTKFSDAFGPPA